MGIIEYTIIGAVVGGVISLVCNIFKPKKKSAKSASKKTDKPKEQPKEPAKTEPVKIEPDRSFKVAKKEKLTRISKKALETNSRTATIERVFERTPSSGQPQEDVYINSLNTQSQQFLDKYQEATDPNNRKVVSLVDLKGAEEPPSNNQESHQEEYSSAKYISSGRAGEITGNYFGVHMGSGKYKSPNKESLYKPDSALDKTDFADQPFPVPPRDFRYPGFDGGMRSRSSSPISIGAFNPPETQKQSSDIDFGNAVVAEAILNPKYKNFNKNKKSN